MNRFGKIMLSSLFIFFIFIIGIYMIVNEDHEVSYVENRILEQLPELTSENVITGEFMKDFETYFTDQFPGRDVWLKAHTQLQIVMDKTYVNNFYITANDWIMPKPSYGFRKKNINTSTANINNFAKFLSEKEIGLYYFMVPHKVTLFQSLFPSYIKKSSSDLNKDYFLSKLNNDIVTIDMVEIFRKQHNSDELENMYFKTDHHWNGKGALEAYKIIANTFEGNSDKFQINKESLNESYYQEKCISSEIEFKGSYNKQIYMTVITDDNEKMCAFIADDFSDYEVYESGNILKPDEVYFTASNESDVDDVSYSGLYTTDYSELTIINPNKRNGKILVIKDSYANALVYHIAQNFYQTTIYDIRYNQEHTVKDYIQDNSFDDVAIIYNSEVLSGVQFEFDEDK